MWFWKKKTTPSDGSDTVSLFADVEDDFSDVEDDFRLRREIDRVDEPKLVQCLFKTNECYVCYDERVNAPLIGDRVVLRLVTYFVVERTWRDRNSCELLLRAE